MRRGAGIPVPFGWFPHRTLRAEGWKALTPSARLVFFRLCDQAVRDEATGVWVARSATRYIARLEGMHHDTVGEAVKALASAGLIEALSEPKRGRIPRYRIVTDRAPFGKVSDSPAISDVGSEGHLKNRPSKRDVGLGGHIGEPFTLAISEEASADERHVGPLGPHVSEADVAPVLAGFDRKGPLVSAPSERGAHAPSTVELFDATSPSGDNTPANVQRCGACGARLYFVGDECACAQF